jgi:hypothetical protein
LKLIPPSTVKLDLRYKEPESPPPVSAPSSRAGIRAKVQRKPSWWAARATTGEVTPGFTKAEILRQAPEDPRAPDGVLVKVTDLLVDLQS